MVKIKKYIPKFLLKLARNYKKKSIINYYKSSHEKKALLSYITRPFVVQSIEHTNFFEATSWAKILDELGYTVDIIEYDRAYKINNLESYDLICGFGEVFQQYFDSGLVNAQTIYYATGMHISHQNTATLKRARAVFEKKGTYLLSSARYRKNAWGYQTMLVDSIIALGNEYCAKSYEEHYEQPVLTTPAPFYELLDGSEIIAVREESSKKGYLWFGSAGLVHKGLDLLLEYFSTRPDLELHVCGPIEREQEFVKQYYRELYELPNITSHGFVDLTGKAFKDILLKTSFIVFPSCSEGGCASVITTIGNGGLIPVISKESTVCTGDEVWIHSLDFDGLNCAIKETEKMSFDFIKEQQDKNLVYVKKYHTRDAYYIKLKDNILTSLRDNA